MPVDILMATFNGEKYIRNQLLSLQAQTYEDWVLWVRDDGSTDRTAAIVDEFAARDQRIKRVPSPSVRLGPGKNFLGLIENANSNYVAFSDQDDVWFERKLELLVRFAADRFEDRCPCLAYCDAHVYSDTDGVITSSQVSLLRARSLREFLFFNGGYQGSSMLFNRSLAEMARSYTGTVNMHDDMIILMAQSFGKVFFLPKALMLYRQHEQNVTGRAPGSLTNLARHFFRRGAYVIDERNYQERAGFYEAFKGDLTPEARRLFQAYLRYPKASLMGRILITVVNGFSLGGHRLPLLLKTLVRPPIGYPQKVG